jgi:glutamate-1-semialdehyde aminotransferase
LDQNGLPAIAVGGASFWQVLFLTSEPTNQMDILASDRNAMRRLDLEMLRRGIYVLPGVRRFVSAANTEDDFEMTVAALGEACRAIR